MAEDKIQQEFLIKIKETAQRMYLDSGNRIDQDFSLYLPEIADSLSEQLCGGLEAFHELEERGRAGPLRYIYFSYLRTSILYGMTNYRLDFYDERNRVSLIECSVMWDFDFIFSRLEHMKRELGKEFGQQTRVPGYELDTILYDMAGHYKTIADKKLGEVLQYTLQRDGAALFGKEKVSFYVGELFDRIRFLLRWEQGDIVTLAETMSRAEEQ